MESKRFHELVNKTSLSSKDRETVWNLFKTVGVEKALEFIQDVQSSVNMMRQGLALQDTPVPYKIWGKDLIESGATDQMGNAARLPIAVAGALMPDAHSGYGLPIGGVLATDNAVIPYAVGVDIACRMMITVYPVSSAILKKPDSPEYRALASA
ncbi:MAG TPA: RtcB family protein, partial [Parachlamydiaceae bacterium]|nr:RtcB family protein [Parachlamydiaceae bacterium]